MLSENKIKKTIGLFYFTNLSLYMLFGRTYSGLYTSSFRIGELITGFFLLFNLLILIVPVKYLKFNINLDKKIVYTYKLIIVSFFLIMFSNNGSYVELYSYK